MTDQQRKEAEEEVAKIIDAQIEAARRGGQFKIHGGTKKRLYKALAVRLTVEKKEMEAWLDEGEDRIEKDEHGKNALWNMGWNAACHSMRLLLDYQKSSHPKETP